ncbi:MAG: cation:proton antiporter [Candidatus Woesearchaeota archaeon]
MILKNKRFQFILLLGLIFSAVGVFANSGEATHEYAVTFLWIAIILIFAKLSSLVEKFGQPAVLGELVIGIILGNLGLLGMHLLEPLGHSNIIGFLAELGVVILLFQIGLESNIAEMGKVGVRAFLVAIIGVVVPFITGTFVGQLLMPGLELNAYLFMGAALTATSVGITARVFKDLGKLQIKEAKIVLGAAVIDDVLGLVILAVVSAMATAGTVSAGEVGFILGKAILFLVAAVVIGHFSAPTIGRIFSKIHTGVGMKLTMALCFGLVFAYLANLIGLAAIVGAFAAGLVLDPVHFRRFNKPRVCHDLEKHFNSESASEHQEKVAHMIKEHDHKHVEDIIEPIGHFLVPIFFVMTGFMVKLETLFDVKIILIALAITVVAIIGKVLAGTAAGKVNKWLVGFGMVPRGEVGLIFATIGKGIGVVNDAVFSVIVIMVILTTLVTPPILNIYLKKMDKKD